LARCSVDRFAKLRAALPNPDDIQSWINACITFRASADKDTTVAVWIEALSLFGVDFIDTCDRRMTEQGKQVDSKVTANMLELLEIIKQHTQQDQHVGALVRIHLPQRHFDFVEVSDK